MRTLALIGSRFVTPFWGANLAANQLRANLLGTQSLTPVGCVLRTGECVPRIDRHEVREPPFWVVTDVVTSAAQDHLLQRPVPITPSLPIIGVGAGNHRRG